jgi:hypothetical protein
MIILRKLSVHLRAVLSREGCKRCSCHKVIRCGRLRTSRAVCQYPYHLGGLMLGQDNTIPWGIYRAGKDPEWCPRRIR